MRTRSLYVGPHTLAIHERGDGVPVVLLHSGGLSSRQWRRLGDALVANHQVVAPDLLGYGASSKWPEGEPFEFRQDVAAVVALLDELPPAHLVGHSYGGLMALQAALVRPAAVRSLALYEPVAMGALDQPGDAALRASLDLVTVPFDGDPWLGRFVDWWNGPGAWDGLAPEGRAAFRDVGWKLSREVISLIGDHTTSAAYGAITVPTLLLGGELTPAPEQMVLTRLAAALPAARLERLAGAGHMGPITHAAQVNAAIVAHVSNAS